MYIDFNSIPQTKKASTMFWKKAMLFYNPYHPEDN